MYPGATVMPTGPEGPVIVTLALPVFELSALVMAVITMGFAVGTLAGARKSTPADVGPVGDSHGSEPEMQIHPIVALPSPTPLTSQETAVSGVPETLATRGIR